MNENMMQHGIDWRGQKINEFIATEKFDGCRAYWDGAEMWSRGGIKIQLPESWRVVLPKGVHLDGEIYDGVDGVYRCGAAVKYGRFTSSMEFKVFDCPMAKGNYINRLNYAKKYAMHPIAVVDYQICTNFEAAISLLNDIIDRGGEGLMLRHPDLEYTYGRTFAILKFKANWQYKMPDFSLFPIGAIRAKSEENNYDYQSKR